MPKTTSIPLDPNTDAAILYEDRSVLAIDKPPGWMLVPVHWKQTQRNLQRTLEAGIAVGEFWATCRNLKHLRFIHRLDADTSGVLLLAKSPGAMKPLSELFAQQQVTKRYLAVVSGAPKLPQWTCRDPLGPDPANPERQRIDRREGKPAETEFRVLEQRGDRALIEARPRTGRTHQIRVHLASNGLPVMGDAWYGVPISPAPRDYSMGLRSQALGYRDPFSGRLVWIEAPVDRFTAAFGFQKPALERFGPFQVRKAAQSPSTNGPTQKS